LAVKDKTPWKLLAKRWRRWRTKSLPSPSQTFLESSTGRALKHAREASALPNYVSVAKGSGPALAERARRDFGSARSRRARGDFQTGAKGITTRNSV